MYSIELLKQIIRDMRRHKLRSILAIFGIVWGTVSIVLLLALGEGFYVYNKKNMTGFAEGAITLFPGTTEMPFQGYPLGRDISIKAKDIIELRQAIPEIHRIVPIIRSSQTATFGLQKTDAYVIGTAPDYILLKKLQPKAGGRFIDSLDIQAQRQVAFLDTDVAKKLFNQQTAVGKIISINNIPL